MRNSGTLYSRKFHKISCIVIIFFLFLPQKFCFSNETVEHHQVTEKAIDEKATQMQSNEEKPLVSEPKIEISQAETKIPNEIIDNSKVSDTITTNTSVTEPYSSKPVEDANYEPYLSTFNLGTLTLSDDFIIYGRANQANKYFISITTFAKLMEIPLEIKSTKDGDILVGWFLKENNKIEINISNGIAKIGNSTFQFTNQDAIVLYTDLLISIEMLEKMLPMNMKFNSSQQVLDIQTTTPFPIEQEISRQEALGKLNKDKTPEEEELHNAKLAIQEYSMFSMPNIDINYSNIINAQNFKTNHNLGFVSKSHLLKSTLSVTGGFNKNGLNSMLISAKKTDGVNHPFEHYLHPKQYWVGDIASQSSNLISSAVTGIGASISNIPAGWKIDFNNLQITGYSIPNWSVEVYLNNNLLTFSTVDSTGFYMFQEIPLNTGLNTIKLIFYGPFGQTREVIEKVNLSSSLLKKGKVGYEISVIKENTSIIKNPINNATNENQRYFGNIRYGLGNETSVSFGTTSYMKNFQNSILPATERQNYLSSSIITTMLGVVINTDIAHHLNSQASAAKFSLNTPIFKESNLFLTSQFFTKGFISETRSSLGENTPNSITEARLKNATKVVGKAITGTYTVQHLNTNSGNSFTLNSQHSLTVSRALAFANNIQLNLNKTLNTSLASFNATYKSAQNIILRGTLNYSPIFSQHFFTTSTFNANYNLGLFGITTAYNINIVQRTGSYIIGLNINSKYLTTSFQFGTDSSASANINLNFNQALAFHEMKPKLSHSTVASGGIIEISAFIDSNNNGKWDFDELPAQGVGVKIAGSIQKEITNEKGKSFVVGLPVEYPILFNPETTMMTDSSYKPAMSVKRKVILKAGAPYKILIPIVSVIDIDGTISVQMGEDKIPIGNVDVQLIDRNNQTVAITTTTPEGYYVFNNVVKGIYKIKIPKEKIARYKKYLTEKYAQ